MKQTLSIIILCLGVVALYSCATARKAKYIEKQQIGAMLSLVSDEEPQEASSAGCDGERGSGGDEDARDAGGVNSEAQDETNSVSQTIEIEGEDGGQAYLMTAVKDAESGEMVASETLNAAVVTSRFRNVAERHGKVDISFQIIVPETLKDSKWQVRFQPLMRVLEDTLRLDSILITGRDYRRAQLRGYERYRNWLERIVDDPSRFIDKAQLEIFVQRNIPELYAMKRDSSFVSDETFASIYGVTEREAVEHYTNKIALGLNNRRIAAKEKMFRKFVKVPIKTEGLRLDTLIQTVNGDFVYNYVQTITAVPRLRKADVILSGAIFEQDKRLYTIPQTEPLTFYISSLSTLVDEEERYLTQVIERRVEAVESHYIEFAPSKSIVDLSLGSNAQEMSKVKKTVASIIGDEVFALDSIVVAAYASPEGRESYNRSLSAKRGESIISYIKGYIAAYRDSLSRADESYDIDIETGKASIAKTAYAEIDLSSHSEGENWNYLDCLVENDSLMLSKGWTQAYKKASGIRNADAREESMKKEAYYPYMKKYLYPRLRKVDFVFNLHRKGMVKDTIHTTMIDSVYMAGVQAIRLRDYERAVALLTPYKGFNLALAYLSLDRNASAREILESLTPDKRTAAVNYLLAIVYSRFGEKAKAQKHYLDACRMNPSYKHRGNLDPEIYILNN
ncbi:MAG: hypothetical protein HUJ95_01380 [Bacteroidales bacterium]|nr:hypothetical protein [Bacteroidales bacterium]